MERIPVPDVSECDRPEVTKIVDGILAPDADTTELEDANDGTAYDHYGLTRCQVEVVNEAMR